MPPPQPLPARRGKHHPPCAAWPDKQTDRSVSSGSMPAVKPASPKFKTSSSFPCERGKVGMGAASRNLELLPLRAGEGQMGACPSLSRTRSGNGACLYGQRYHQRSRQNAGETLGCSPKQPTQSRVAGLSHTRYCLSATQPNHFVNGTIGKATRGARSSDALRQIP